MKYFGGKSRIAKSFLKPVIEQSMDYLGLDTFVDMFAGSMNVVSNIDGRYNRFANDLNKYIIDLYEFIQDENNLQHLPDEVTEEEYKAIRDDKENYPSWLVAFVGFGISFSGKWFGGYCRDKRGTNYTLYCKNSLGRKTKKLKDVTFTSYSYDEFPLSDKPSLIYCDIPYKNTTDYGSVKPFNHEHFYKWCLEMENKGHCVLVSEYEHNVPEGATIIAQKYSKKDVRDSNNERVETSEVLWRFQ